MKELKVRVWDIDGGKMSAGFSIDLLMQNEIEIQFPDTDETLPFKDFIFFRKEFSGFMLATGVLDYKGIEIYEGDIVTEGYNGKYGTFEVKWGRCGYNLETVGDGHFKIVGNIYDAI